MDAREHRGQDNGKRQTKTRFLLYMYVNSGDEYTFFRCTILATTKKVLKANQGDAAIKPSLITDHMAVPTLNRY